MVTKRQWSGVISCHSEQGWYPAATFVDSRGECGLEDKILANDIQYLRKELRFTIGEFFFSVTIDVRACQSRVYPIKNINEKRDPSSVLSYRYTLVVNSNEIKSDIQKF